jgi:probable phosphoglycerate mutase
MRIILSRHGNTFGPSDKVVWVGKRNDLPLTTEGLMQAEQLGRALKSIKLEAAYFAPLQRTKKFAETVLHTAQQSPPMIEDARLTELDYGDWSGLSDQEIAEKFGSDCLKNWGNQAIWPTDCGWTSTEEQVTQEVQSFVQDARTKHQSSSNILVVSSNGRLRYFLKLIPGEFEKRVAQKTLKVGTGKSGVIVFNEDRARLPLWNEAPEALSAMLLSDSH